MDHALGRRCAAALLALSLSPLSPLAPSPLALGPTAHAAPAPAPAPTVTARFTTAPAGVEPTGTLHWTVTTPVITSAMVGRPLTIQVTSPASVDCGSPSAGVGGTTLRTGAVSCTATTVTWTLTPTRAMVGASVVASGWSAVASSQATLRATVTTGRTTSTASTWVVDGPTPCAGTAPIGPLQAIPTGLDDPRVATASSGMANEVWIDGDCLVGPVGVLLDDDTWLPAGSAGHDLRVSAYDPASGELSTLSGTWYHGSNEISPTIATSDPVSTYYAHAMTVYRVATTEVRLVPLDGSPRTTLTFQPADAVLWATTDAGGLTTISHLNGSCTATLTSTTCPATLS